MKRVLVSVKSVQRDIDGQDTVVELISPGTSHEKKGLRRPSRFMKILLFFCELVRLICGINTFAARNASPHMKRH